MSKEYGDEDIFELTEDMASFIPPVPDETGQPSTVESNQKEDGSDSEPIPERPSRPSYIPRYSDVPVVTTPIKQLGSSKRPSQTQSSNPAVALKNESTAESQAEEVTSSPSTDKASMGHLSIDSDKVTLVPDETPGASEESESSSIEGRKPDTPEPDGIKLLDEGDDEGQIKESLAEALIETTAADEEKAVTDETVPPAGTETELAEGDLPREAVFDLGTPQAVFDSIPGDSPADDMISAGEMSHEEEAEEIDLSSAVDLTDELFEESRDGKLDREQEVELKNAEETEETQEIDLDDAEELRVTEPPPFIMNEPLERPPRTRRKRGHRKEWWASIFDDDYLSLLPGNTARKDRRTVDFVEQSFGLAANSLVLDLACGNGRHAVDMARRGYRVVGVDLSLPMLAQAGELAQEADQKINFIHGDMRDLGFDKTFDAVYCIGTSFGYFDDPTNFKVLEGVARALKPGAPFLLDVANRDYVISQVPQLTWFEGNGSVCMEETHFNFINSRLYVARQLIIEKEGRQVKHELSLRLYSLHELGLMLHNAGFRVSRISGHTATPGAFFGPDSTRTIILAETPQ